MLLAAVTLVVFWPAIHFDFIDYDDNLYVYANSRVLQGLSWANIRWAFSNWETGYWHPMTWLSLFADTSAYGTGPGGYHTTNLLLHCGAVMFLYLALERMTAKPVASAFVAALFALHPLRLESVVWISERKGVLSSFFGLLGVWAYAGYFQAANLAAHDSSATSLRRRLCYLLAIASLALSLMSKPTLLTFPFVLLLLDFWPLNRAGRDWATLKSKCWPLLLEKVPFVLVCGVFAAITFSGMRAINALADPPEAGLARVLRVADNYGFYLEKAFWPERLVLPYPAESLSPWKAAGRLSVLVSLTALAVRLAWACPWLFVGWFWFLGVLVPVIGFTPLGRFWVADRYMHLPLIGLALAATWTGVCWFQRSNRTRAFGLIGAVAAVVLLGAATRLQLPRWKSSLSLFSHAVATAPSLTSHGCLGVALFHNGRYEEAAGQARQALALSPGDAEELFNLGNALARLGRFSEAVACYRKACLLVPGYADSHINLGRALLECGDAAGAQAHLKEAVRLQPDSPLAHLNLGLALVRGTNSALALTEFETAIRLQPDQSETHAIFLNNLAWPLATDRVSGRRNGKASALLATRACELTGYSNFSLLQTLAAAQAEAGQFEAAVATERRALNLALANNDELSSNVASTRLELFRSRLPFRE